STPPQRSIPPRKEKSLRVVQATAVSPPNPRKVTRAALWIAPGAKAFAIARMGTKMIDSITTKPARAAYWAPFELAVWATRLASQLTIMNAPRTMIQLPASVPAIDWAMFALKSAIWMPAKAAMERNRVL